MEVAATFPVPCQCKQKSSVYWVDHIPVSELFPEATVDSNREVVQKLNCFPSNANSNSLYFSNYPHSQSCPS